MLGDAFGILFAENYSQLEVDDEVGTVRAVRPMPNAIPVIAMAARTKATPEERIEYMMEFVIDHLAPDEMDRILLGQMLGAMPEDTIGRIARALSTWGTERPYTAVVTLSVMAAHHWRTLRMECGTERPMESYPNMHVLLDKIEKIILEAMVSDKPKEDIARRKSFLNSIYKPDVAKATKALNEMTPRERRLARKAALAEAPAGFEDTSVEASFDAFTSTAR
jgi:hypothetical protein